MSDRSVLVTGATSLLGRLVIAELLARGCKVHALLRSSSPFTRESLANSLRGVGVLPWEQVSMLHGDVWEPDLGLGSRILSRLGGVTEIIHLARPRAKEEPLLGALLKGMDGVIELARRLGGVKKLVVLSSTEIIGDYPGRFYEDWLDVGQKLQSQKAREILEAEKRAREAADYLPLCIVRHATLVGNSCTGQMECDEGLGRVFAWGESLGRLPSFVRLPGPAEGQRFFMVSPVDYVAESIVELCFMEQLEVSTFCLADPDPPTLAELYELLLERIGAPPPGLRIPVEGKGAIGSSIELFAKVGATFTGALGQGLGPWSFILQRGDHDVGNALAALEPAGVTCPRLVTYLDALYEDYRRRHER